MSNRRFLSNLFRKNRRKRKKKKVESRKKMEFSKVILSFIATISLLVIIFSCVMIAVTKDLMPLSYLIPAVFAELATGTAFYYSKAKAENEIKIMKSMENKNGRETGGKNDE